MQREKKNLNGKNVREIFVAGLQGAIDKAKELNLDEFDAFGVMFQTMLHVIDASVSQKDLEKLTEEEFKTGVYAKLIDIYLWNKPENKKNLEESYQARKEKLEVTT